VYPDVGIPFVVLKADVVIGAVLLDEVHLEDQGFEFGSDDDPFDIADFANHLAGLVRVIG